MTFGFQRTFSLSIIIIIIYFFFTSRSFVYLLIEIYCQQSFKVIELHIYLLLLMIKSQKFLLCLPSIRYLFFIFLNIAVRALHPESLLFFFCSQLANLFIMFVFFYTLREFHWLQNLSLVTVFYENLIFSERISLNTYSLSFASKYFKNQISPLLYKYNLKVYFYRTYRH